ncbi:MAG: DNA-processing protein DprA [Oscillospiraceae bacterium]|nr:DNA-processing protein DprA [Oscillospiraceae bacterium]
MKQAERGFLLLSSCLGDPSRRPLTTAQLRVLADRSWRMRAPDKERELEAEDLMALGYGREQAERILALLAQDDLLEHYLYRGRRAGCVPLTRVSEEYPLRLRKRLGLDSPGVLWAKGDLSLLNGPMLALVGSRDLQPANEAFAREVGRQAARQGYTLVSGNARGSDRAAQYACLAEGGRVISVVADELANKTVRDRMLYLSEEDFDREFSTQRALSRNRVIHALGDKTLVAQCGCGTGGTWNGTVRNLRFGWSPVFCFRDGSAAAAQLEQMGASLIEMSDLLDFQALCCDKISFF